MPGIPCYYYKQSINNFLISFPNGVFIESLEHPGLVWDIKGL